MKTTIRWTAFGFWFAAALLLLACTTSDPAICDDGDIDTDEEGLSSDGDADSAEESPLDEAAILKLDALRQDSGAIRLLRLVFLSPDTEPSGKLGVPWAEYAFMTAADLYDPPLPLEQVPVYSGLTNWDEGVLLAMVCHAAPGDTLKARLATWPALFEIIRDDLGDGASCPAEQDDAEGRLYCAVADLDDTPDGTTAVSLARMFSAAVGLFADEALAEVLRSRYGVYPEFSGLGYSVKTYGNYEPMSAAIVARQLVSPEYLVRNVTLTDAECACIKVDPYEGRAQDKLDLAFVEENGAGDCPQVERLQ